MTPLQLLGLEAAKGTYKGAKKAAIRYETVILAVVAFYAVRYLKQQADANKYQTAGAGTSEAVDFARRLHDAFHPFVNLSFTLPLLGRISPPDGTNETELKALAAQIGSKKIGQEVSAAYKAIYGVTLEEELTSEGVYDDYITAFSSGSIGSSSSGSGSGGSGSASGSSNKYLGWVSSTPDNKTKTGDFVYSYADKNLRDIFEPEKVVNKSVVGEKYKILRLKFTSIGGTLGWWLWVEETSRKYSNGFILQEYIIYSGSTYKK